MQPSQGTAMCTCILCFLVLCKICKLPMPNTNVALGGAAITVNMVVPVFGGQESVHLQWYGLGAASTMFMGVLCFMRSRWLDYFLTGFGVAGTACCLASNFHAGGWLE